MPGKGYRARSWLQIQEKMTSKLKVPGLGILSLTETLKNDCLVPGSLAKRANKGISEAEPMAFLVKGQQFAAKTYLLT